MSLMKFDLEKATAMDVKDIAPKARNANMVAMSKMLAMFAVECPLEWGAPDNFETYSKQSFRTVLAPAWKELVAAADALDIALEGVEFDLDQVTPEMFDLLSTDLTSGDPVKVAAVYAQFVRKLPKSWGDPSKPETYLKLKYYTQFAALGKALSKAGRVELENFLKLLTSD